MKAGVQCYAMSVATPGTHTRVSMCFDHFGKKPQEGGETPASGERAVVSGERGRKRRPALHYLLICTWNLYVTVLKIANPKKL